MVSKKPTAETLANNPLIGDWKLVSYNGKDVVGKYTAAFEADRVSLRFCNVMNGAFKLTGNTFSSSGFISTEMYCEGEPMVLEGNFDLNGATYAIKSTRSIPPVHILTITTKKGNTYTFKR
ncbi:MAG: META domain-containing protein [Patescibacteria group bacterium]